MPEVANISLFVHLLYTEMLRSDYEALPDRAELAGLPVAGATYRDASHPGVIFRCRSGINWSAYSYTALAPKLLEAGDAVERV